MIRLKKKYDKVVLGADVGGTNTNFAIVGFKKKKPKILLIQKRNTKDEKDFCGLVNSFLEYAKKKVNIVPKEACFAVAGIIEEKKGQQSVDMTHSHHVINSKDIARKTPLRRVILINDFEAVSYAVNMLSKKDYKVLNKGKPVKNGVLAVVGAGTGFGKSILYFDENKNSYVPLPSEGGHSDLPILDNREQELGYLIKKIRKIKNQVRYEDVLSGRGLEIIYHFLQRKKYFYEQANLTAEQISKTKNINRCSRETFKVFMRFYARCCRNFVLDALSTGGLYIAGGIAAKNTDSFTKDFVKEFRKNETFPELLKNIPIYVIKNYDISTLGAAYALLVIK